MKTYPMQLIYSGTEQDHLLNILFEEKNKDNMEKKYRPIDW
jgi:hypothetical protein